MSDAVEALLARMRAAALQHGPGWLEDQVRQALPSPSSPPSPPVVAVVQEPRRGQRRSRAPERLSPDATPRSRRQRRSPDRDPPAASVGPLLRSAHGRSGRNPARRPGSAARAGRGGRVSPPSPTSLLPAAAGTAVAAGTPAEVPGGSAARRADRCGLEAGRHAGARRTPGGGAQGSAARTGSARSLGVTAVAVPPEVGDLQPARDASVPDRGRGAGGSSAPCDVSDVDSGGDDGLGEFPLPPPRASDERRAPGQRRSALPASTVRRPSGCPSWDTGRPALMSSSVGSRVSGGAAERSSPTATGVASQGRPGELTTIAAGNGGAGAGTLTGMHMFFQGLHEWFSRGAVGGAGSPVGVWGAVPSGGVFGAPAGVAVAGPGDVAASTAAGSAPASGKAHDEVRLADAARGEVYVCFDGPLGAHLKAEVRDKIWKDEYVEIFSLLPLEKFNLDRVKPDECKKEEEERRRYRLIPRTFANWLQAFAILASVVGEKAPDNCSALFCYLDSVGEAYRVYGGNAWLRYDEQFRQRKAVRPSLRWDHKDISLWMRLMAAPRSAGQSFHGGAGGSGSSSGRPAANNKGCCWQFNEGQCKFGTDCRYKHECSGCGGAHGLSRCFKKGRGKGGDSDNKRGDPGEGGKDAPVLKGVPR